MKFERKYNKMFLNDIRRAIEEFNMIENGEKVAVGLSGGKDSIFLLYCLNLLKLTKFKQFELMGISIDLGLNMNMNPLVEFCKNENIPLHIEKTNIGEVVFSDRKEKNPCALCSNLRKGALVRVAKTYGVNKVALGHNSDDVIETLFMNVLKVGQLGAFHPCIYQSKHNLTMIRPMVYLREDLILKLTQNFNLPIIQSNCPEDKKTTREEMKLLIKSLEMTYPDAQEKILKSLKNIKKEKLWL